MVSMCPKSHHRRLPSLWFGSAQLKQRPSPSCHYSQCYASHSRTSGRSQPHSLLSALQLAALLGASCASIMPLRVFPCAQQCKQMQSNARRVDMLASNAMSPPCMWVSSFCPQAFHASGNTTRNNLLSKRLVFA